MEKQLRRPPVAIPPTSKEIGEEKQTKRKGRTKKEYDKPPVPIPIPESPASSRQSSRNASKNASRTPSTTQNVVSRTSSIKHIPSPVDETPIIVNGKEVSKDFLIPNPIQSPIIVTQSPPPAYDYVEYNSSKQQEIRREKENENETQDAEFEEDTKSVSSAASSISVQSNKSNQSIHSNVSLASTVSSSDREKLKLNLQTNESQNVSVQSSPFPTPPININKSIEFENKEVLSTERKRKKKHKKSYVDMYPSSLLVSTAYMKYRPTNLPDYEFFTPGNATSKSLTEEANANYIFQCEQIHHNFKHLSPPQIKLTDDPRFSKYKYDVYRKRAQVERHASKLTSVILLIAGGLELLFKNVLGLKANGFFESQAKQIGDYHAIMLELSEEPTTGLMSMNMSPMVKLFATLGLNSVMYIIISFIASMLFKNDKTNVSYFVDLATNSVSQLVGLKNDNPEQSDTTFNTIVNLASTFFTGGNNDNSNDKQKNAGTKPKRTYFDE
jgi:hypothetical protein